MNCLKKTVESNLKEIYNIQSVLEDIGYLDVSRISQEIVKYCKENDLSIEVVLKRLKNGEPWEYVRGFAEFRNLPFYVNRYTLIPRIESEDLVDIAKEILDKEKDVKEVWDIGTGTGCLIISLALEICNQKEFSFYATDVDMNVLDTAKRNSLLHKVNNKVSFIQNFLLNDMSIENKSLIIANLPYVPSEMYENLDCSVKDHEPKIALDGGNDGLKYYKTLLSQLEKLDGILLIEIEPSTLPNLKGIIKGYKYQIIKDFRDKERFVLIHLS